MRELIDHKIEGKTANLRVFTADAPGHGGAHHNYIIEAPTIAIDNNDAQHANVLCQLSFQNGPIAENGNGINGIQHEALIAIIIDRLRSFQSGNFSCRENAIALTKLEEALMWLSKRTRDRIARGVEGTHTV